MSEILLRGHITGFESAGVNMGKVSLYLLAVCMVCALDQTLGNGYYVPSYLDTAGIYDFSPYSAILQPDCDKSKEESKESSSESSSEEKKDGSKEESKGSLEEGSKSSSEESGSKEEKKEGSEEKSKGESEESKEGEKKEDAKKKKSKEVTYVFPPRTYTFPARQMQQVVYSPASSYNYFPYRSSYVVQQPAASYPVGTSYQYLNTYTLSSPVARIVYSSPAANYATGSVLTPGARVYSAPAAWNSQVAYYK